MSRGRVLMLIENVPLARDHRLRKQAAALLADGADVTVICRADPRNRASVPGARVLQYPAPPEGSGLLAYAWEYGYSLVMAALLTLWEAARRGFDALQVASTPDIYFLLAAPCRWLGKPVVFDFRDPSPETYQARFGRSGGAMMTILRVLERRSLRAADQVLVVNESLRVIARDRGGVAGDRITEVGNGPAARQVARGAATPGLRRGFPRLCCWVGMIGPQDRVDLALRAVSELVHTRHRTDCAFVFAGAGDALPAARRLTAELGIGEWVSFPGWVEEDTVFDYLATADLGLEPNTEDYVSGVKVMEYLAAGLPVVAFEARENARLAGGAARYVPKGDVSAMAAAIDTLLDDGAARAAMSEAGRRRFTETIAWDRQADRYLAVTRRLLAGQRGAWAAGRGAWAAGRDAASTGRDPARGVTRAETGHERGTGNDRSRSAGRP